MTKVKIFDWREVKVQSQAIIEVFSLDGKKRIYKWGPKNLFGPLPDSVLAQMTDERLQNLQERMSQLEGLVHLVAPISDPKEKEEDDDSEIEVEYV